MSLNRKHSGRVRVRKKGPPESGSGDGKGLDVYFQAMRKEGITKTRAVEAHMAEARMGFRGALAQKLGREPTKKDIRIQWLRKCHERAKLRRQYPEIDWDRPHRDACSRRKHKAQSAALRAKRLKGGE